MKKVIFAFTAAFLASSLFAYDLVSEVQVSGGAKGVTRTDFSVASKFGEYFRTPVAKYIYTMDASGRTAESSELTVRDVLVNKIKNTYDSTGNLKEQNGFDSDGNKIWKSTVSFKNGKKVDVSEFGKDGSLKSRIIYSYTDSKLADETVYNSEGTLVEKTTYKYDDKGRISVQDVYFDDGSLAQESVYTYTDNGKKDTVTYYDKYGKLTSKCIFRYAANGSLSEVTTYGADNQTTSRQLVKYDNNGNVSRITTYSVAKKFGTTVNEMTEMSEFAYNYTSSSSALTVSASSDAK